MDRSSVTIAITSVGGGVGQSILKALTMVGYTTVALDADPLAVGLYASPISYIIPHSKDPQYIEKLLTICKKEKCSILFPGSDTELATLSQHVSEFEKIGTRVVVSRPEVIALADDKWQTYETLTKAKIAVPHTQKFSDFLKKPSVSFPVVLKPMIGGSRSQNVKIAETQDQLEQIKNDKKFQVHNTVVQEFIDSEEYTCGSVTLDGICYGVIVMRRILRDGDTYKCFSVRHPAIEAFVTKVVEEIKPVGACNIQLRLKNGKPYLFEINARCSGTTAARALAGFNEPAAIADYYCFQQKPKFEITEVSILRYWKEFVVENEKIEKISTNGRRTQKATKSL